MALGDVANIFRSYHTPTLYYTRERILLLFRYSVRVLYFGETHALLSAIVTRIYYFIRVII